MRRAEPMTAVVTGTLACEFPGRTVKVRTGTHAGYRAHQRAKEKPCDSCSAAHKEYLADYYLANKDRSNERSRAYLEEHREHLNDVSRRYYRENREDVVAAQKSWRARNRETYLACVSAYQRRRLARIEAQSTGERVDRLDVAERDEWTCQWCSEAVDPALAYPDPRSMSIDHRIPLAAGGAHGLDNVQLLHLRCNVLKGASVKEG